MNSQQAVRLLMRAGHAAMQLHPEKEIWWGGFNAAAELLSVHNKGMIDLRNAPITWTWLEKMVAEEITPVPLLPTYSLAHRPAVPPFETQTEVVIL